MRSRLAYLDAIKVLLVVGWLFGLGLFFLIAGRLTAPSLDRKGPSRFAKERLIRLGIPLRSISSSRCSRSTRSCSRSGWPRPGAAGSRR